MDDYPLQAPGHLRYPSLTQRWERLTFVHWRYDPADVQAILPDGLTVDTFDGSAWVGLVPFHMIDVRPPFIPTLHPITTFPETNIRTYVRGSRGQGVWFCTLEITRLLGVAVARTFFGVPYAWAEMSIDQTSERIRYASRETNYCATCQTGGNVLADRSLSRLLGDDWPRSIEDWEERRGKRDA